MLPVNAHDALHLTPLIIIAAGPSGLEVLRQLDQLFLEDGLAVGATEHPFDRLVISVVASRDESHRLVGWIKHRSVTSFIRHPLVEVVQAALALSRRSPSSLPRSYGRARIDYHEHILCLVGDGADGELFHIAQELQAQLEVEERLRYVILATNAAEHLSPAPLAILQQPWLVACTIQPVLLLYEAYVDGAQTLPLGALHYRVALVLWALASSDLRHQPALRDFWNLFFEARANGELYVGTLNVTRYRYPRSAIQVMAARVLAFDHIATWIHTGHIHPDQLAEAPERAAARAAAFMEQLHESLDLPPAPNNLADLLQEPLLTTASLTMDDDIRQILQRFGSAGDGEQSEADLLRDLAALQQGDLAAWTASVQHHWHEQENALLQQIAATIDALYDARYTLDFRRIVLYLQTLQAKIGRKPTDGVMFGPFFTAHQTRRRQRRLAIAPSEEIASTPPCASRNPLTRQLQRLKRGLQRHLLGTTRLASTFALVQIISVFIMLKQVVSAGCGALAFWLWISIGQHLTTAPIIRDQPDLVLSGDQIAIVRLAIDLSAVLAINAPFLREMFRLWQVERYRLRYRRLIKAIELCEAVETAAVAHLAGAITTNLQEEIERYDRSPEARLRELRLRFNHENRQLLTHEQERIEAGEILIADPPWQREIRSLAERIPPARMARLRSEIREDLGDPLTLQPREVLDLLETTLPTAAFRRALLACAEAAVFEERFRPHMTDPALPAIFAHVAADRRLHRTRCADPPGSPTCSLVAVPQAIWDSRRAPAAINGWPIGTTLTNESLVLVTGHAGRVADAPPQAPPEVEQALVSEVAMPGKRGVL